LLLNVLSLPFKSIIKSLKINLISRYFAPHLSYLYHTIWQDSQWNIIEFYRHGAFVC